MTAEQMLDYTFNQLDGPARIAFEHALSRDPVLADRVNRLDRGVASLLDDGEVIEPPAGLRERTLGFVAHRNARPLPTDYTPSRTRFRMADFAVAATVFFAAILTLSVPLLRSRMQMDQTVCASNLGKLGVSLGMYKTTHGEFPLVPASLPVGTYGLMLQDARALDDPNGPDSARRPSKDKVPASALPSLRQRFCQMAESSPRRSCRDLRRRPLRLQRGLPPPRSRRGRGRARTPPRNVDPHRRRLPRLRRPEGRVLDGNSPNHGGRGQNVLYADGHLEWRRNRWVSQHDSDLYLNEAKQPAAGLHSGDAALMRSSLPAWGR